MHWFAPSEKDTDTAALEKRLWDAADQFRANSGLQSQEYSAPVLALKHGGNINSYHDDPYDATGRFHLVLTKPTINATGPRRIRQGQLL